MWIEQTLLIIQESILVVEKVSIVKDICLICGCGPLLFWPDPPVLANETMLIVITRGVSMGIILEKTSLPQTERVYRIRVVI